MNATKQQDFSTSVKEALLYHPEFSTVSDLARSLGYHRNTVSRAINQGCFLRVRKQIASALKISLS
jgi:plasmid maintenance system antidote protein VapI